MIKIIWRSEYDRLKEKEQSAKNLKSALLDSVNERKRLLAQIRLEINRRFECGETCRVLAAENKSLKQQNASITRDNHEVEQIIKERDHLKRTILDALKYLELNRGGRTSKNTLKAKQLLYFTVKGGGKDE